MDKDEITRRRKDRELVEAQADAARAWLMEQKRAGLLSLSAAFAHNTELSALEVFQRAWDVYALIEAESKNIDD